jgi:argininosuccinate synthase
VVSCSASKVKKVVLAYSGGLDTSVILKWLQETYECEVIAASLRDQRSLGGVAAVPPPPCC